MKYIPLFISIFIISACSVKKLENTNDPLSDVMKMMKGSYDSSAQANADSSYYNISLQMYPIWKDRAGHYLYVEQALAAKPEKPYRQRIYKVELAGKDQVVSKVYTIENEADFIGKWASPEYFNQFDPSIMIEREGCGVYLKRQANGNYEGATNQKDCKSTLRGASYATSIVSVQPNQIVSWDQGFNDQDQQVWGAEKGGYIFVKKK